MAPQDLHRAHGAAGGHDDLGDHDRLHAGRPRRLGVRRRSVARLGHGRGRVLGELDRPRRPDDPRAGGDGRGRRDDGPGDGHGRDDRRRILLLVGARAGCLGEGRVGLGQPALGDLHRRDQVPARARGRRSGRLDRRRGRRRLRLAGELDLDQLVHVDLCAPDGRGRGHGYARDDPEDDGGAGDRDPEAAAGDAVEPGLRERVEHRRKV
jgi:hypothetical protein